MEKCNNFNYWEEFEKTNNIVFEKFLPDEWKNIFNEEYSKFSQWLNLYWFYNDKWNFVWWVCLWFNPDFFDNKDDIEIITELNVNWYIKISYFFILDKYKWEWYWKKYLTKLLDKDLKYYLTCNWDNLKKYYESIWFRTINTNNEKHILIYGWNCTR